MAQEITEIRGGPSCTTCSIVLQHLGHLDPSPHTAAFTPYTTVARDSRGNYVAGPMIYSDSALAIFTPSGSLHHLFGRLGQGPDEFLGPPQPMLIRVGAGDEVYISEAADLHLLEPGATGTLRKTRITVRPNDMTIIGRTVAVQWTIHEPGGRSTPIQILDAGGKLTKGIGRSTSRPLVSTNPFDGIRRISGPSDKNVVWSAYLNRYEISAFDLDGNEELQVVREAPWFKPYDDLLHGEGLLVPQRPRIDGIRQTDDGLLWVLISRGAKNFSPIAQARPGDEARVDMTSLDLNRYFDTIIEVLDIPNRRVLARLESELYLRFVDTPGTDVAFYVITPRADGSLGCEIFAATLRLQ